jgi:uncharacterized repeat protein (TIGR03806 family)
MRVTLAFLAMPLLLAATAGACSSSSVGSRPSDAGHEDAYKADSGKAACAPGGAGVTDDTAFPATVDAFCQVSLIEATITPTSATVVPYDLNTPLFSDYAVKFRTVWLPPGTKVSYAAEGRFVFPVGTVITKSFGWPADFTKTGAPVHWAETRVLVNTPKNGWVAAAYEWNSAQSEAQLALGGDVLEFSFVGANGKTESPKYLIPSQAQCRKCHANDGVFITLGPSAAQLNGTYVYATGAKNQITAWSELGILSGAPSPSRAPLAPVWNDPKTGTVEERAREYLDANCSYCHNGKGEARTTGLVLLAGEMTPAVYGVCKSPVAAGKAAENQKYDVVPGHPELSILAYRMTATEPSIAMPELERSLEHVEGVELVSQWITGLPGSCP